jgi:hypothetical protein
MNVVDVHEFEGGLDVVSDGLVALRGRNEKARRRMRERKEDMTKQT